MTGRHRAPSGGSGRTDTGTVPDQGSVSVVDDVRPDSDASDGSVDEAVAPAPIGRVWAALLGLALCAAGLLSVALPAGSLSRSVLVGVAAGVGIGIGPALLLTRGQPSIVVAALVTPLSLGLVITVGTVTAVLGAWAPVASWSALCVLGGAAAAAALVQARGRSDDRGAGGLPRAVAMHAGLVALALAAVVAAAAAGQGPPTPRGLGLALAPVLWPALLVIVLVGADAWRRGVTLAPAVIGLAAAVPLAQAVAYGMPTVVAAARHLGVSDVVAVTGGLDRAADIYQAWPGLFAGTALAAASATGGDAATAAGVAQAYAVAWAVLVAPATAVVTAALARRFLPPRSAWGAAALATVAGTLNVVYFSPQSVGFLLGLAIIVVALEPAERGSAATRLVTVALLTVPLVLSHQISPFLVGLALLVLAVGGWVRPLWLPAVVLVPAVAWALANRSVLRGYLSWDAVGRLLDNLRPPSARAGGGDPELVTRLTFGLPVVVVVLVVVAAAVAWARRRDRTSVGLVAVAVSPAVLVVATDYGAEGVFRVVLFALPWLAILACRVRWAPASSQALVGGLVAVLLVAVQVLGLTGMDWARVQRADDFAATRLFESTAPDGSVLLVTGSGASYPVRLTYRYTVMRYAERDDLVPLPSGGRYNATADATALAAALVERGGAGPGGRSYAVFSDVIAAYGERYGLQSARDYRALAAAWGRLKGWTVASRTPTTVLYRYDGAAP